MYIGIDAGGTKTDVCLCAGDGSITALKTAPGINAARLGSAETASRLAALINSLNLSAPCSLYAGIAGAGNADIAADIKNRLSQLLPGIKKITVASDAFNGLNTEVGLGDGIALIAGTGSSAFVRINGSIRQVGGRGSLIDDAGGGYWLGRECLNAAYRALDGRGEPTQLLKACERLAEMPLADAIPEIYSGGVAYIAGFAPLVFECAAQGDHTAQELANRCAHELWLHISACIRLMKPPYPLCAATGGMFRSAYLRKSLEAKAASNELPIVFPVAPPVIGAVIAAAGPDACKGFTDHLKSSFPGRSPEYQIWK